MNGSGRVSIVIPTLGRPELLRAVDSALQQDIKPREVIVVVDDPLRTPAVHGLLRDREVTILAGSGQGAGAARQHGTLHASGKYVAYLDDDDWWDPAKLSAQIRWSDDATRFLVVSDTLFHFRDGSTKLVPANIGSGEAVEVIGRLIARKRLRLNHAFIQSSSLMLSLADAIDVGWRSIPKHQDWDFVARALIAGLQLKVAPEPLVHVQQGSKNSVSSTYSWNASAQWLEGLPSGISSRSISDFVWVHGIRPAVAHRDVAALKSVTRKHPAALPHLAAAAVAVAGGRKRVGNGQRSAK